MEIYFRAFRYDTSEQRVTYEAEYNTDITVEPMYRFLINMNHGSELPFGLAEARRFSHVRHFNADDDGHLSVRFGLGEEGFTENQYTGPLRDDEVELKAEFFQDVWFWKFTLLTDWEKSLELFGDIADFSQSVPICGSVCFERSRPEQLNPCFKDSRDSQKPSGKFSSRALF